MAIEEIDTLQSDQLATLETHLNELKTKLNLMVADILAVTAKTNIVIDDMNDMNNLIMEGYTVPGSPESYGILEAMDVYKDKFKDHIETYSFDTIPDPSLPPNWQWWPDIHWTETFSISNCNSTDITGTLTGASWSSSSNVVTFTGTTGTIALGQRMQNSGSEVGNQVEGATNGAMIVTNTTSPLYLSDDFYQSGSGTLSFVAKAGTIHYGTYWDSYWDDLGPWNQDWFEHPRANRAGRSSYLSGSAGPSQSYDAPVVDGTGQGTNSSHTAGAEDSIALGDYQGEKKIILSVGQAQTKRAKKLARQTLNRLRK
tara:strand:- start:8 stop:946 length:939 start_codon:yes stop_codon:yes gene_type:complete